MDKDSLVDNADDLVIQPDLSHNVLIADYAPKSKFENHVKTLTGEVNRANWFARAVLRRQGGDQPDLILHALQSNLYGPELMDLLRPYIGLPLDTIEQRIRFISLLLFIYVFSWYDLFIYLLRGCWIFRFLPTNRGNWLTQLARAIIQSALQRNDRIDVAYQKVLEVSIKDWGRLDKLSDVIKHAEVEQNLGDWETE